MRIWQDFYFYCKKCFPVKTQVLLTPFWEGRLVFECKNCGNKEEMIWEEEPKQKPIKKKKPKAKSISKKYGVSENEVQQYFNSLTK